MRVYLGSGVLQSAVADFFAQAKPVGAICHGVLLAARSSLHPGKSVLFGKKTTALCRARSPLDDSQAGAVAPAWFICH
jgi:putative intracellular protease/amidase